MARDSGGGHEGGKNGIEKKSRIRVGEEGGFTGESRYHSLYWEPMGKEKALERYFI